MAVEGAGLNSDTSLINAHLPILQNRSQPARLFNLNTEISYADLGS